MALNIVLVAQRQSAKGVALSWNAMEGVSAYQVFIAQKRLTPEELEAAQLLGGTDECQVLKVGSEVHSVVDDVTPQGEPRHYGVAMVFDDGAIRAARFKALPDGGTAESLALSGLAERRRTGAAGARPLSGSAPAGGNTGSYRLPGTPPPAARAAPVPEDPLEAHKRAQREARTRAAADPAASPRAVTGSARISQPADPAASPRAVTGSARISQPADPAASPRAVTGSYRVESSSSGDTGSDKPAAAPADAPAEDPMEARKRQQAAARAARDQAPAEGARPPPSAEPPAPPSSVPLEGALDVRMSGATQTWDGLRIHWEREPRAAAYEIIASDHQIFGDELADALAGRADFTTAVAVAASVTCVIDNVTAREARGWYAVLARTKDGQRTPVAFKVGDAAASGKAAAPFLNANRTGEVRAEATELVEQAKEQWARWQAEQDRGAQREARRLVQDALLIFPGLPAAKALESEMG